jgi:hypothetical protein
MQIAGSFFDQEFYVRKTNNSATTAWSKLWHSGNLTPVTGTGTSGQVAYWSSGSAITGESNLFWDATNDRLGIGTNIPLANLHIAGTFRNSFGSGIGGDVFMNIINGVSNGFRTTITTSNQITYTFHNGSNTEVLNILNSGAATFSSSVTASSIIRSGGTSSQYLMADGSVSTLSNPVTGSGTTNYLPKFTGASTIGNSTIQDDGTNVSITGGFTANSFLRVFKNGSDSLGVGPFTALYNAAGTAAIFQQLNANNGLDWWTTFGRLMTLDSSGNLGIGTASLDSKLQVEGASHMLTLKMTSGGFNALTLSTTFSGGNNYAVNPYITGVANGGFEIKDLTNNASRIVISPSSGNVLINSTTDAGFKLDVNGTGRFSGRLLINSSTNYSALQNTNTSGNIYWGIDNSTGSDFTGVSYARFIYSEGAYPLITYVNGAERMRIASTGAATFSSSVTANAASQINGTAALSTQQVSTILTLQRPFNSGVSFENTATFNVGQGSTYRDGRLDITLSNTDRVQATIMTLLSSGNVGIGTTTPSGRLDVANTTDLYTNLVTSGNNTSSVLSLFNSTGVTDGAAICYNVAMRFGTVTGLNGAGFTERMRITSGGDVLIGTTTPNSNKLRVNGNVWVDGNVAVNALTCTSGEANTFINPIGSSGIIYSGASTTGIHQFLVNSAEQFAVTNTGIRTSAPTGGSVQNWKLGNAVNGTVNANRLIRVEIAGVGYDLVARQII